MSTEVCCLQSGMVLARVLTAIKRETERGPLLWFVAEDSSRWAKGKEERE